MKPGATSSPAASITRAPSRIEPVTDFRELPIRDQHVEDGVHPFAGSITCHRG
jgi:hypothetical protein